MFNHPLPTGAHSGDTVMNIGTTDSDTSDRFITSGLSLDRGMVVIIATNRLKATLQRELDAIVCARDALREQIDFAEADTRVEWARLDNRLARAREALHGVRVHASGGARELEQMHRHALDALRRSYDALPRLSVHTV
jgi:hypothetical protein